MEKPSEVAADSSFFPLRSVVLLFHTVCLAFRSPASNVGIFWERRDSKSLLNVSCCGGLRGLEYAEMSRRGPAVVVICTAVASIVVSVGSGCWWCGMLL